MYEELKQQHEIALHALELFNVICINNNIDYYLIAGSALGGVRHKGFIPWDDDIDIAIRMEDEARLEKVLCSQLSGNFCYKSMHTNDLYPRLHGKILFNGRTCIDVFPLIRISDNRIVAFLQWKARRVLEKLYYRKIGYVHEGEKPNIVRISKAVSIVIPKTVIIWALKHNAGLCQEMDTKRFINIYSIYSMEKEIIDSSYLDGHELLEFEGATYPTLNHVHSYLAHLYGDYMQLPPEDQRKAAHEELF